MTPTPVSPARTWWRFFKYLGFVQLFNVGCAFAISALAANLAGFPHNLLLSVCIGTIAFLIIHGMRRVIWGEARPKPVHFMLLIASAASVAPYAGVLLAKMLTGQRVALTALMEAADMGATLVFTLLATGVLSLFFFSRERILRAEAHTEALARQALQAQLQMLQAQIEPHMLFNTLANLQGLIGLDPARAQQMLEQLIVYLRATLITSRADSVTLADQFALMEAYLGLMQVRMGARLSYHLALPPALRSARVPPMLLQPLVENAIQHGLEPKVEGGHVAVSVREHEGVLTLEVADTGLGLGAPGARAGTGVGLANTRARLLGLYGGAARLELTEGAPCGAVARLTLPLANA
jgi:LytS/YehU family sensor histidine kinase